MKKFILKLKAYFKAFSLSCIGSIALLLECITDYFFDVKFYWGFTVDKDMFKNPDKIVEFYSKNIDRFEDYLFGENEDPGTQ